MAGELDNHIVIGKIPGYNDNINKRPTDGSNSDNKIDYTNRLLNNLTTVVMRPTGYTINYGNMARLGGLIDNEQPAGDTNPVDEPTTIDRVTTGNTENSLYKIGSTVDLGASLNSKDGPVIGTSTALSNWHNLVEKNITFQNTNKAVDELRILCTNDSTMTEVFGNTFDVSTAEQISNKIGDSKIGQIAQTLKKSVTVDSTMGMHMLRTGSDLIEDNQLLNVIAGKALGIQSSLPKEWFKADYNNSLQLMIKLISPAGDSESIKEYILKPLQYIIMSASPITYDGITYGYPTIWEIEAEGMMKIKLAGVSALTITRGGNETQFNRFNQPLNVDVRMTIEPLVNGFAARMDNLDYERFLVTNPGMLKDSITRQTLNYKTIKL